MYLYLIFIVFKKLMLQAANTDHFNPLIPKAHNSECQNLLFHGQAYICHDMTISFKPLSSLGTAADKYKISKSYQSIFTECSIGPSVLCPAPVPLLRLRPTISFCFESHKIFCWAISMTCVESPKRQILSFHY